MRICPGRYRIADPGERGVIVAAASGTRIDLTGVLLESGDSVAAGFTGVGIASKNVDGVSVLGGTIRGYRIGIRLEGGRGHRVTGSDLSGSRTDAMRSTRRARHAPTGSIPTASTAFTGDGRGLVLVRTVGASVTGVTAAAAQNGIGLIETRDTYIADNELTGNSGWAISLWRSSHNVLIRNRTDRTSAARPRASIAAPPAILVREGERLQHDRGERPHRLQHRPPASPAGGRSPGLQSAT